MNITDHDGFITIETAASPGDLSIKAFAAGCHLSREPLPLIEETFRKVDAARGSADSMGDPRWLVWKGKSHEHG